MYDDDKPPPQLALYPLPSHSKNGHVLYEFKMGIYKLGHALQYGDLWVPYGSNMQPMTEIEACFHMAEETIRDGLAKFSKGQEFVRVLKDYYIEVEKKKLLTKDKT